MYILIIFSILFLSYTITLTILNSNIKKYINRSQLNLVKLENNKNEVDRLYYLLNQLNNYKLEHLIFIFIIPMVSYLFLMYLFRNNDIYDSMSIIMLLLFLKLVFCIFMIIKNSLQTEENEIGDMFTYVDNQIHKNNTNKNINNYRSIVSKLSKNFNQIYTIVYSLELVITLLLIFITYKYEDLVD